MNSEVMSAKGTDVHQKKKPAADRSHGQLAHVTEVWLICAPGNSTPKATWDAVNQATSKPSNLSTNFKFYIPELKAGIYICTYFINCKICLLQLQCPYL